MGGQKIVVVAHIYSSVECMVVEMKKEVVTVVIRQVGLDRSTGQLQGKSKEKVEGKRGNVGVWWKDKREAAKRYLI